jgi:formamidopyrimidine-DNA glycosylase
MPELPEVETIRRQLNEVLVGKTISKVEVLRQKSFGGDPITLKGWVVEKIDRKSKIIEIYFKDREEIIIVHLKMTGQLVFLDGNKRIVGGHPTADWVKELPSKHTRVIMEFSDKSKLFFNDMRVFGWMRMIEKEKYENEMRKTAPDVTEKEFSLEYLKIVLKKSGKAVKLVLMDQEKIGGVGNIYANDALYLAKVLPSRKANSLSGKEIINLLPSIREVINKGIKYGGASAANYVDTKGMGGTYQDHFLVYKKEGQLCKICKGKIQKMKIGGRGTFYCPNCQH